MLHGVEHLAGGNQGAVFSQAADADQLPLLITGISVQRREGPAQAVVVIVPVQPAGEAQQQGQPVAEGTAAVLNQLDGCFPAF